jgi:flavodoxin I
MKIGLIYGSDTGNTETVAETLRKEIGSDIVDLHEVFKADLPEIFKQYDFFILGIPTWYDGEVQSEWGDKLEDLEKLNLTGCRVAIYGLGDQEDWGEYFCDAMAELANRIEDSGGTVIGHWPSKGYNFTESKSLIDDDTFVGLTLDEDRQSDLTEERIQTWIGQLKRELRVVNWQDKLPQFEVVES